MDCKWPLCKNKAEWKVEEFDGQDLVGAAHVCFSHVVNILSTENINVVRRITGNI